MGEEDTRRQHLNVARTRLLGTDVRPVATGTATLKDAINEALRTGSSRSARPTTPPARWSAPTPTRSWSGSSSGSSATRPAPRSWRPRAGCPTWRWPASAGVERGRPVRRLRRRRAGAAGRGGGRRSRPTPGDHGASLGWARPASSTAPALRPPGPRRPGPPHPFGLGRPRLPGCRSRARLLEGRRPGRLRARLRQPRPRRLPPPRPHRGPPPALEPAHAVGWLAEAAGTGRVAPGTLVVLNPSGRGDKDVETVSGLPGRPLDARPGAFGAPVERLEGGRGAAARRAGGAGGLRGRGVPDLDGSLAAFQGRPGPGSTCSRSARSTRTRSSTGRSSSGPSPPPSTPGPGWTTSSAWSTS